MNGKICSKGTIDMARNNEPLRIVFTKQFKSVHSYCIPPQQYSGPIISLLSSIASVIMIVLNSTCFIRYKASHRIIVNAFIFVLAYATLSVGWYFSFYVVVIGGFFNGIAIGFGEVSHYTYLQKFPSNYVGPFVSGTGISGLTGSLLYVMLHAVGVQNWLIFWCLIPMAFIYLVNFIVLCKVSETHNYFHEEYKNPDSIDVNEEDLTELDVSNTFYYIYSLIMMKVQSFKIIIAFSQHQQIEMIELYQLVT